MLFSGTAAGPEISRLVVFLRLSQPQSANHFLPRENWHRLVQAALVLSSVTDVEEEDGATLAKRVES